MRDPANRLRDVLEIHKMVRAAPNEENKGAAVENAELLCTQTDTGKKPVLRIPVAEYHFAELGILTIIA